MLKSLLITNFALVERLEAEFPSGLVIVTGETGSGKSIIIGALGLLLGARASAESVRQGSDKAVVEGIFQIAGNKRLARLLKDADLDVSEELILRREVSAKGQSRCFASDTPVTQAILRQIGELLVDLHGQHEHQSLLRLDTHIAMVDDFGGLDGMVDEFRQARRRLQTVAAELETLRQRERQLEEKREFYQFQLNEIDSVSPREGEEEELERELTILENAEKLYATTGTLFSLLLEGEQSVRDQLVIVRNQLQDLSTIDPAFIDAAGECASAEAVISELARFLQGYNAKVEFNPERLEELRERLGKLALLKRKFGGSVESTLAHREHIAEEIALAENFDEVIRRLESEVGEAARACAAIAQRLSVKRHDVARKVDKGIVAELAHLGMAKASFSTRITQIPADDDVSSADAVPAGSGRWKLNPRGYDDVEFYISTNTGEEEKPLVRIVSGGEISRIMLAMKSILAKSDRLPVLVFDEIDVGVSGRIAQAVGKSLKSLSEYHQILAITHLPQIAGLADAHFIVSKSETKGRTTTAMKRLSLDDQVREVARLMSGSEVTDAGLQGARELMGIAGT
jgi:DNA repair protein RecN (Recombination protein N)